LDLADIAHHAKFMAQVRLTHGHPDALAAFRQRPHHLAANESRPAKNNDQLGHELLHQLRFSLDARWSSRR
jgi:hypothetical protein